MNVSINIWYFLQHMYPFEIFYLLINYIKIQFHLSELFSKPIKIDIIAPVLVPQIISKYSKIFLFKLLLIYFNISMDNNPLIPPPSRHKIRNFLFFLFF